MAILDTLISLLISFLVIVTPVGIIVGVVLLVLRSNAPDEVKKKRLKTGAIWCIVGPIVLLFLALSGWGLVHILTGTAMKQ